MLNSSLGDKYIPSKFQDGRPIEHVILICDVDGVVRSSTEANADARVITLIRELIADQKVDVAFISGTPIAQDPSLELWRRGNITLDKAVGSLLAPELQENKITIFGALGGQRMTSEGQVEILEEYSLLTVFELGKLLLYAFLMEIEHDGSKEQKELAADLKITIEALKLENIHQSSSVTPLEFSDIIHKIHTYFDPNFRLISYGSFIETHTSNPPWNTSLSSKWIHSQLNRPHLRISQLSEDQKQVATGLSHRDNAGFYYLMISKINKGLTIKKHIQEKQLLYPHSLVVTIGDTQVDFPMHKHADLAYHVGQEQVWGNHYLPQCMLVKDNIW